MDIHAQDIIFEILPPPKLWETKKVLQWIANIKLILQEEHIHFLSLPEVIAEERTDQRQTPLIQKHDNLRMSILLQRWLPEANFLPNKVVVKSAKEDFVNWLHKTSKAHIKQICLVGKEKETLSYPGYTVEEATFLVKHEFPEMAIGGITIFTRPNEARRIFKKMQAGMSFFCSQIIFETANLKQVILELKALCEKEKIAFPKIFVSLSPAARLADIYFIKWLGAEFPSAIYSFLVSSEDGVQERSFAILQRLIEEILYFKSQVHIDLGFNIEHVCYTNLQLAGQLIHTVKKAHEIISKDNL